MKKNNPEDIRKRLAELDSKYNQSARETHMSPPASANEANRPEVRSRLQPSRQIDGSPVDARQRVNPSGDRKNGADSAPRRPLPTNRRPGNNNGHRTELRARQLRRDQFNIQVRKDYRKVWEDRQRAREEASAQWSLDNDIVSQVSTYRPLLPYILSAVAFCLLLIFLYLALIKPQNPIAKRLNNLQMRKNQYTTVATDIDASQILSTENQELNTTKGTAQQGDQAVTPKVTTIEKTTTPTTSADEAEFAKYDYYVEPGTFLLRPVSDAPEKVVFITIDDAPDQYALEMAQVLKEKNVPAVFLVNGHFLYTDDQKARLKELHSMGFQIGNHTMTHPHLLELTRAEQKQQIHELTKIITDVVGEPPRLFRPPFGEFDDQVAEYVHEDGMVLMGWTFGFDWNAEYMEASALADIMTDNPYLKDGANILIHDREWTLKALPTMLDRYRDMGYGFVDPEKVMPRDVALKFFTERGLYQD